MPLTAGDQRNSWLSGQPPPRVGHMHASSLMPDMDQLDVRRQQRVENRHDVVAGKRKNARHAQFLERSRDKVRASDHVFSHPHGTDGRFQGGENLHGVRA